MKTIFHIALAACLCTISCSGYAGDKGTAPAATTPRGGMLYFASYGYENIPEVIQNPYILGGFYTMHWSEIETKKGVFDWKAFDRELKPWFDAGKKVVLRIMWSSSGYWKNPAAATPTPAWVWKEGAKYAYHPESKTEIPLIWDPIFKEYAMKFIAEMARHFDGNPNVLFFDVTPGAETNPYRFGTINLRDPGFKDTFAAVKASDGRTYSNEVWVETVTDWIRSTAAIITKTPCLVTLNVGSLDGTNNFPVFGQCAVDNGMYVGQNGLNEKSYNDNDQARTLLFREWAKKTKLCFEMVHAAETSNTGTLMGVMQAAERIGCDYLNVYAIDVVKSTPAIPATYQPRWEEAMKYGYDYFNGK